MTPFPLQDSPQLQSPRPPLSLCPLPGGKPVPRTSAPSSMEAGLTRAWTPIGAAPAKGLKGLREKADRSKLHIFNKWEEETTNKPRKGGQRQIEK